MPQRQQNRQSEASDLSERRQFLVSTVFFSLPHILIYKTLIEHNQLSGNNWGSSWMLFSHLGAPQEHLRHSLFTDCKHCVTHSHRTSSFSRYLRNDESLERNTYTQIKHKTKNLHLKLQQFHNLFFFQPYNQFHAYFSQDVFKPLSILWKTHACYSITSQHLQLKATECK